MSAAPTLRRGGGAENEGRGIEAAQLPVPGPRFPAPRGAGPRGVGASSQQNGFHQPGFHKMWCQLVVRVCAKAVVRPLGMGAAEVPVTIVHGTPHLAQLNVTCVENETVVWDMGSRTCSEGGIVRA